MLCPTCGAESAAEATFCRVCGTRVSGPPGGRANPGAPPPPPPPPGFSQTPPPPPPAFTPAPGQPYGGPAYIPPAPARPASGGGGSKAVVIVGIVVGVIAILALLGGGLYLLLGSGDGDDPSAATTIGIPTTDTTSASSTTAPATSPSTPTTISAVAGASVGGYPTAEAAVRSVAPSGWVLQMADETGGQVEYWSGPPQSEWMTAYLAEQGADGTWSVVDSWDLGGTDVPFTEEDEVRFLVEDFLYAIMYDDPDYAHDLTVEPFASDPASAQYGNGDFLDFNVAFVEAQSDGTYWVKVEEEWSWGTERWRYHAVPTEAGWRINDLRDW